MSVSLHIVPTPIGNLDDISFRAIKVLKEVDIILAEDTRKTGILCKHFEINARFESHHKFNEHKVVASLVERAKKGTTFALVSDAGTPAISDPGFLLVKGFVENNIEIQCLPGATAFVPALVVSGLPNDKFVFEGFLPQKKGRQKRFKELANETRTMVFYESPHRIVKMLEQILEFWGDKRNISISREISKIYEETLRGTAPELLEILKNKTIKGEIVVVVEGNSG